MERTYFRILAGFYLGFGLIATFHPRLMQLFMTEQGIDASTSFSDQVWLTSGADLFGVCLLLLALSTVPATKITLRAAASVALLPVAAIVYTFTATSFWNPLFLIPAALALAFALYGFGLAAARGDVRVASDP